MKKILSILLFITYMVSLFSCKGKDKIAKENLNKKLFVFFKENINKEDSTAHLDSVRILKMDTLTRSRLLYAKEMSLYDDLQANKKIYLSMKEVFHSALQLAKLYASLDKTLYENYRDEAVEHLREMKDLVHKDSLLMKSSDSLEIIQQAADTTKLLYYEVKCLIQYQRKDMSVKRDTGFAYLTPEKDIIRREDMLH